MKDVNRVLATLMAVCAIGLTAQLSVSADVDADVNHDGSVNCIDLLLTKECVLGVRTGDYDANGDGVTNVIDVSVVKNLLLDSDGTGSTKTATQAPATQAPTAETLTDGHGNTYPDDGYTTNRTNGVVYKVGSDGYEMASNYAAAVESYYGISMTVSGNSVAPTCLSSWDATGSLDELNTWRAGRSASEIGVTEICNNWSLICNDPGFWAECRNYLDSLDLSITFSSPSDFT